jgi:hypothetical protein
MITAHCLISIGPERLSSGIELLRIGSDLGINLHVVWRDFCRPEELDLELQYEVQVSNCSLSHARNILLEHIFIHEVLDDAIIFFGDDDGLFPLDLKQQIHETFADPTLLWTLGCYGPDRLGLDIVRFPDKNLEDLSQRQILKIASSLGIYARGHLVKSVGFFDERIGIGTSILVGEDTEYALRLRTVSDQATYSSRLFQFHPYKPDSSEKILARLDFLFYLNRKHGGYRIALFRNFLSNILRRNLRLNEIVDHLQKGETDWRLYGCEEP